MCGSALAGRPGLMARAMQTKPTEGAEKGSAGGRSVPVDGPAFQWTFGATSLIARENARVPQELFRPIHGVSSCEPGGFIPGRRSGAEPHIEVVHAA
jgi:hypothetical protein